MPFDLDRFVAAQEGSYPGALAELRAGRKTGHWMWFVFPQLAGLGRSALSLHYAIGSLDEARAYAGHPVLGRGYANAPPPCSKRPAAPPRTSSAASTRSSFGPR